MFKLYWAIDGHRQDRGTFDTVQKAIDKMKWIVDTESKVKPHYQRQWKKDDILTIDYGAHNAKFQIEYQEDKNEKG